MRAVKTESTNRRRRTSTLRCGPALGTALGLAVLVAGCTPTGDTATDANAAPATTAPASDEAAAPNPGTIPFEAGHVPEGWSERDGVECGMSTTELATQDDRFRLEVDGPLVTGADGVGYLPVSLTHELGDDVAADFGDDVQLVWSQDDVVVDLDLGWHEGGGPILRTAGAEGLPTDDYATWEQDAAEPARHRMSGLAEAGITTTCWPGDEGSGSTSYDEPRPDGSYDVRAAALAIVDGESSLVVSDPVTVEWVAPPVD